MNRTDSVDDLRERDGAFDQVVDRQSRRVLGNIIRKARMEAGYTQAEMSERIGVPQTTISKIERAHRDITLLEYLAMCETLSVSPHKLITQLLREISPRDLG